MSDDCKAVKVSLTQATFISGLKFHIKFYYHKIKKFFYANYKNNHETLPGVPMVTDEGDEINICIKDIYNCKATNNFSFGVNSAISISEGNMNTSFGSNIMEGYIIKFKVNNSLKISNVTPDLQGYYTGTVIQNDEDSHLVIAERFENENGNLCTLYLSELKNIEVIGNIYECS